MTDETREIAQALVDEGRGYGTWEHRLAEAYITEVDRLRGAIEDVIADLETWLPSRSSNLVLAKLRAALE